MARVISFFPKQLVSGSWPGNGLYSEIYDITDISRLVAELHIYTLSPSLQWVSGFILESSDPTLDMYSWQTNAVSLSLSSPGSNKHVYTGLAHFIRACIAYPSGLGNLAFQAVGRN